MMDRLRPLVRAIAIGVPVVGALPTAFNLYQSWKHGIPYSQVAHKLEQYDLWVRNMDCPIEYKELTANQNTKVNIGVCPTNGDISIKVSLPEGKALIEWIAFERLKEENALANLLIGTAYAEDRSAANRDLHLAQATNQVVCQGWESSSKIVRVLREGARCFRETISPYQGRIDKRTEVPCLTGCPAPKAK
jgi:hypothetical protein